MPKKNKGKGKSDTAYLSEPFTKKQVRREVRGAARTEFGESQRILKGEKRASRMQSKRIGDYFSNYDQQVGQAQQTTGAAYAGAQQQMGQTAAQATGYAEQLRSRLAQEGQADATRRGVAYDPSGSETAVAANLARLQSSNTLQGVTATQGANAATYLADKKAIGGREEIEQKLREASRRRSITQDQKSLAKDKGAFKNAKKSEIVDRERDYLLGVQAANLSKRGQKADIKAGKRSAKEIKRANKALEADRAQDNALAARQEDRLARQARFERRHPGAGSSSSSSSGGGGKGEDSSRSVGPGKIKSYLSANVKPELVAKDPQRAIQGIMNRWPYLSRKYVAKIVGKYSQSVNPAVNPNASGPVRP